MKKPKTYIIYLVVFLTTFLSFGQTEMRFGHNEISTGYKPTAEINREFKDLEPTLEKVQIILKRKNDSIVTIYIKNNLKDTIWLKKTELTFIYSSRSKRYRW